MGEPVAEKKRSWLRLLVRWTVQFVVVVVVLGALAFVILFREPLWRRYVTFPRQAEAWKVLATTRQNVVLDDGWTEYRGVCHAHSELSHDSEVKFPDILRAAKIADISFICMTDHAREGKADYTTGWKGLKDGVLFIRGFEMNYGYMPWGLPDDTVLANDTDPLTLAEQIASRGGVIFYAHSEQERDWDLPQLTGMEIYNIHTDVKDEGYEGGMGEVLKQLGGDFMFSLGAYPDHTMRLLFDRQTDILKNWDEQNKKRRVVGIAASDAHQNFGVRGFYTDDGNLAVRDTGPPKDEPYILELNVVTRGLLRMIAGPLEPGRQVFRVDLDRYERSLRYVNTHVLARSLTEPDIIDALRNGRVFIAFDMIADARGFTFLAECDGAKAVMGEEIPYFAGLTLKVAAPLECRFTMLRDGEQVAQQTGRQMEFSAPGPGNYRVEAELLILDEWTPWIYANPIRVTPPTSVARAE